MAVFPLPARRSFLLASLVLECEALFLHRAQHHLGLATTNVLTSEDVDGLPAEPGCYILMPRGCPDHPSLPQNDFFHDKQAEENLNAHIDQQGCLRERRQAWASWCSNVPIRAVFVGPHNARTMAGSAVSEWTLPPGYSEWTLPAGYDAKPGSPVSLAQVRSPVQPGCYLRAKGGCLKHDSIDVAMWTHDFRWDLHKNDRYACEVQLLQHYKEFCGTDAVEAVYIPQPGSVGAPSHPDAGWEVAAAPTVPQGVTVQDGVPAKPAEPGCYMWAPTGCRKRPKVRLSTWTRDVHGEEVYSARTDRCSCQVNRLNNYKGFCGTDDIQVLFVPSAGAATSQVCEASPPASQEPAIVAAAASQRGAGEGAATSTATPVQPATSTFPAVAAPVVIPWPAAAAESAAAPQPWAIPAPVPILVPMAEKAAVAPQSDYLTVPIPENPLQPGCYVWAPTGCPRYPKVSFRTWAHDLHGEHLHEAGNNQRICEADRKKHYAKLCGVADMQACFVPPGGRAQPCVQLAGQTEAAPEVAEPAPMIASQGDSAAEETIRAAPVTPALPAPVPAATSALMTTTAQASEAATADAAPAAGSATPVVPATPLEAGCYMWAPHGCPNHPHVDLSKWAHDFWGEKNRAANADRQVCEGERHPHYKHFCGVEHVQVCFVPEGGRAEPCSGDKAAISAVLPRPSAPTAAAPVGSRDASVEPPLFEAMTRAAAAAPAAAGSPEAVAAATVSASTPPLAAALPAAAPPAAPSSAQAVSHTPTRPGCYIRSSMGCPKHPEFTLTRWSHDYYGERKLAALSNRTTCEVDRREHFAVWCEAPQMEAVFVPGQDATRP